MLASRAVYPMADSSGEPGVLSLVSAAFQPASWVPHPDGSAVVTNEAASSSALAVGAAAFGYALWKHWPAGAAR